MRPRYVLTGLYRSGGAACSVRRPLRLLASFFAGALVVSAVLVSAAAPGVRPLAPNRFATARADSDSTAIDLAVLDSTLADSAAFDSVLGRDTSRVDRYLPSFRDRRTASLFQRRTRPFSPGLGTYWEHELSMDSTSRTYVARETVGGEDVRYPLQLDFEDYRQARLRDDVRENWTVLAEQSAQQRRTQRRGGLGVNIVVPGGRQSAFSTIFGKPSVDLRVTGQAYIQAGFDYRKSAQQAALYGGGRDSRTDPTFKQDLNLGITGTIGDKLRVDVSWDTNNTFDYQNQLKLVYTGYEDEIIQSVEAGNVFLQTPSTLIRGGQSLFGIKSQFQLGGVQLTTVASQQEGQANSLSLDGGAETKEIDLRPTDYDQRRHFFLGYYFRNWWNDAHENPARPATAPGFDRFHTVEVWRKVTTIQMPPGARQVVAVVDLGEPAEIITLADRFTELDNAQPGDLRDQYSPEDVAFLRDGNTIPADFLQDKGLRTKVDFQTGPFELLEPVTDYVINDLGYISLTSPLSENEALAVSYTYIDNVGNPVTVGDLSTQTGGSSGGVKDDRLLLKLLRPESLQPPSDDGSFNPAAWYLEMRNIYSLNSYSIEPNDFELEILFEPPGSTSSTTLPGIDRKMQLLSLLGLDRLNESEAPTPDYKVDFIPSVVDQSRGLLIFPYLEPFGTRIAEVIDQYGSPELQADSAKYIFSTLYRQHRQQAEKDTQHDVYTIRGRYKGSVASIYDLGAFSGLVPGSVRVTSGGVPLQEGTDFTVDYTGGQVQIINNAFLTAGRAINITYEQNQFVNFQKKTLLGARAEYGFDERLQFGATMFRLNEKSPVDKFRLGDEPISNTIWGVDGRIDLQPVWLTRVVDALPFLQTKEPSSLLISGEFAQLRPGHAQTVAFERSRRDLLDKDRDFTGDELSGVSYIDDFEGFENTYSLKQPGGWLLAAAPDSIPALDQTGVVGGSLADSLRTNWRGLLGWYSLNINVIDDLANVPTYDELAVSPVQVNQVFPEKEILGEQDRFLQTLDLYFNPRTRGPYNYNTDLSSYLSRPEWAWGGMTQRLPEGYNDFENRNIEFIELIIRPFAENELRDAGPDAKLFIDLGSISEDILPNQALNQEDAQTMTSLGNPTVDQWGRFPGGQPDGDVDVDSDLRRTEDLGLDGLASYDESRYTEGDLRLTEQAFYTKFMTSLAGYEANPNEFFKANAARAMHDPSGDDFRHFRDEAYFTNPAFFPPALYPGGATLQERFSHYYAGAELNSFEAQNVLAEGPKQGITKFPDTEDINLNNSPDFTDNYFQYEIPLGISVLDEQASETSTDDFVVNEIRDANGAGTGWYLVRIPVRDYTRKVGSLNDFTRVESIRMWTTGHRDPITIRVAGFELVGSQWEKSEDVAEDYDPTRASANPEARDAEFSIASINNEENSGTYLTPLGTVVSQLRTTFGQQLRSREQALVMRAEGLYPGHQRAIVKTYLTSPQDLLKYGHLRMFVHMHGLLGDGTSLPMLAQQDINEARSKVRLFVRLGANETNDYYEYEQPLTPSSESSSTEDELWQTYTMFNGEIQDLNSLHIRLSALNELKVERDNRIGMADEDGNIVRPDTIFWSHRLDGVTLRNGVPDPEAFAPPGTRIGIKGNPSLSKISTIVIGIRNPAPGNSQAQDDILEDVTVWVNELRASGYDETNGWAGLVNADFKLADLGRLKANFQAQTDGFGELSSALGERDQNNISNWGFTTSLNLDKFVPERFGWNLPVSFQMQSNTTTPRFSPSRGDVRLEEILGRIDNQTGKDAATLEAERRQAVESAQTHSFQRSFTASIQKTDSESRFLRNTLDGISLSYNFADAASRNPSLRQNDSWQWNTSASYRLNVRKPRTLRPLWFIEDVPLLGILGDLRLNYVPQSLSLSGSARRNFAQSQQRPPELIRDSLSVLMPDLAEFPMREQQSFNHRRSFLLQYNPFSFLNLSFDTNTDQNLNAVGADTLNGVAYRENGVEKVAWNTTLEQAIADGLVARADSGVSAFDVTSLQVAPTGQVMSRIVSGIHPRTETYGQRFTATFQPRLTDSKLLDWIAIQPVTYSAIFNWRNGPIRQIAGASVANQMDLKGGLTLKPQDLWRKFGFYRGLEAAQKEAEQEKQAERSRREAERRRRQEAERAAREQAEAAARAAQDTTALIQDTTALVQDTMAVAQNLEAQQEEGNRPFLRIPKPEPLAFLRRAFLAVTGMKDFNVTYSNTVSGNSTNVGTRMDWDSVATYYTLYDAFLGRGPSLGYRFGLQNRIGADQRIYSPSLRILDDVNSTNRILARTTISPSQNLNISLNWNTDWGNQNTYSYLSENSVFADTDTTQSGNNQSSIWAFGANYFDLFKRQHAEFMEDESRTGDPSEGVGDGDQDGRVVLSNQTVVEDFRQSFIRSFGTLDSRGFLPVPMPAWTVTYSGLSEWPLIRKLVQSATLKHGYSADYRTDFNTMAAQDPFLTYSAGDYTIFAPVPIYTAGTVRVNERYQPLIGVDLTFKNRLITNIEWNRSNSFTLTPSTNVVGEVKTEEVRATASYQQQGLTLPFLKGKRLNNRISFSLTVSYATSDDARYNLKNAIGDAISLEAFDTNEVLTNERYVAVYADHQRFLISPKIAYQFSNRVSADFTLKREQFIGDGSQPSYTNVSGNFNIRVSISN